MEHPNTKLVTDMYAAFARGDIAAIRDTYFAPDIVFYIPGDNVISGEYRGIDEVFRLFGLLAKETGGTFHLEVHDVAGSDDHGVGLVTGKGERNGKPFAYRNIHVGHIKDGKITEWWDNPDMELFAAAWAKS